jgi:hypothetical protein
MGIKSQDMPDVQGGPSAGTSVALPCPAHLDDALIMKAAETIMARIIMASGSKAPLKDTREGAAGSRHVLHVAANQYKLALKGSVSAPTGSVLQTSISIGYRISMLISLLKQLWRACKYECVRQTEP